MTRCDCEIEHCEHWQAREDRFRAATERITALPTVRRCSECFLPLFDCECWHLDAFAPTYLG